MKNQIVKAKRFKLTTEFCIKDDKTFQCLILAGLGFSNRYINKCTGLTVYEISSRCKIAQIKRKDYRDGESMIAQRIEHQASKFASKTIALKLSGS